MWKRIKGLIANLVLESEGLDEGGLDLRTNKERSFDEIRNLVREALRARESDAYVYTEELYDSSVVYAVEPRQIPGQSAIPAPSIGTKLYRCDYSIAEDGTVKLADPQEVERVVSYKPVINSNSAGGSVGCGCEEGSIVQRAQKARATFEKRTT